MSDEHLPPEDEFPEGEFVELHGGPSMVKLGHIWFNANDVSVIVGAMVNPPGIPGMDLPPQKPVPGAAVFMRGMPGQQFPVELVPDACAHIIMYGVTDG